MVGACISDIPTPALLADLDAVDHNVAEISRSLRRKRARLRPHFKNHTVVALAKRQVEAGALGMTVAHLRHAELLLKEGIPSVLVSNEFANGSEIQAFVELAAFAGAHGQELIGVVDLW